MSVLSSTDPYTVTGTAGGERFPGSIISVLESLLTHPTHADGFVDKDDPVLAGGLPGIALASATSASEYVAIQRIVVSELAVVASDGAGTLAIAFGDQIYITTAGILNADGTGTPYGLSLNALDASGAAANCNVLVGVHSVADLEEFVTVQEDLIADGAAEPVGFSTLNGTASCDVTLADGTTVGQTKIFKCVVSVANPPTVTVASHILGTAVAYTFGAVGDALILQWTDFEWAELGGNAQLTEALATDVAALTFGESTLNGTASCDVTLADGANQGMIKSFRAVTSIANPPTVTIANHSHGASTVYTFNKIGDTLGLYFDGLQWVTVGGDAQTPASFGRIDIPLMTFLDEGEGTWIQLTTFGDGDSAIPGIVRDGTENLGIRWNNKATSNDIITQFVKPPDMDTSRDATLHIAAIRSATDATDLVTFLVVAFDAVVGAASGADADFGGTTTAMIDDVLIQDVSLALAAADLAAANGAITISFSPTGTIIATIDVTVLGVWIEYTKLA